VKIVFMGSPEFSVPSLDALVETRNEVCLVVTQPDRRAGRGRHWEETAIKKAARLHKLPVIEFGKGDGPAVTEKVLAEKPDAVVVVAFGHILREPLLSALPLGCVNLHASLLPRWRGVSPIQFAIMHGDSWTGVTVMRMDAGVDTGPLLAQRAVPIQPDETAGELAEKLSGLGADLLVHTLRRLEVDRVTIRLQNDHDAVYAPKLTRSLAPLRWDRPVTVVHNQIRGLQPLPGATSFLGEQLLKITEARPFSFCTDAAEAGRVLEVNKDGICVACGEGILLVTGIQRPGGKPLDAAQFTQGYAIQPGDAFRS
jgi:methionyl-tRNA formyltransferase